VFYEFDELEAEEGEVEGVVPIEQLKVTRQKTVEYGKMCD